MITHTHTHTRLTALFPGLPGWAGTRKAIPIWISLKQETVSGSGISWAICKSASRSGQITMPAPYHSSFFTGRMPFLPPNQQRQSTEGTKYWCHCNINSCGMIAVKQPVDIVKYDLRLCIQYANLHSNTILSVWLYIVGRNCFICICHFLGKAFTSVFIPLKHRKNTLNTSTS